MNDTLRTLTLLPTAEPYSALSRFTHGGGETVNAGVFAVSGNNAIVDWVLVELRSGSNPMRIVATRAGLVQRDGDVVDVDGVSPVAFANQNTGSYYVVVGHRNHLRVMTASPMALSNVTTQIDFTNPGTLIYGTYAQGLVGSVRALWSGDVNTDNRVIANGPGSDTNAILVRVLSDPGNTQANNNYMVSNVYDNNDVNLDGRVLATGPSNDKNMVLTNVLAHPANPNLNANYIVQEQVPAGVRVLPAFTGALAGPSTLLLNNDVLAAPLSASAKNARWQQGLPVPLTSIPNETTLPRGFDQWQGSGQSAPLPGNTTVTGASGAPVTVVDAWAQRASETFEDASLVGAGCRWRSGYNTEKMSYSWGRANTRAQAGAYANWPAGAYLNGASNLPPRSPYPDNVETWWQCELTQTRAPLYDVAVEFQLWLELDNAGDSFEVRFYDVGCTDANFSTHFRGGEQWAGTANAMASDPNNWRNYRIAYPGLQSTKDSKLCIEFKFTSDNAHGNYAAAQGPWLDNVLVFDYQKPTFTPVACQDKEATIHVDYAPGTGDVSKGLVLRLILMILKLAMSMFLTVNSILLAWLVV